MDISEFRNRLERMGYETGINRDFSSDLIFVRFRAGDLGAYVEVPVLESFRGHDLIEETVARINYKIIECMEEIQKDYRT